MRAPELDLGTRIGSVAQLVLQPLDADVVDVAVRREPGQQEARQPAGAVRENEERVAHRRGEEPLVAGDPVVAAAGGLGARRVGADVGAALLLRHAHADRHAALVARRHEARVILGCADARHPLRRQRAVARERRHAGIRHRRRAQRAVFELRIHDVERGAPHMRARAGIGPGTRRGAMPLEVGHQRVVRRMELDLVAPTPAGVERLQHRNDAVGLGGQHLHLRRTEFGAAFHEP